MHVHGIGRRADISYEKESCHEQIYPFHGKRIPWIPCKSDYTERDDANWVKWICVDKGDDGRSVVSFERIPFERYRWKPECWKE